MPRETGSIIWQHITIPPDVGRCVTHFLYHAKYIDPYPNAVMGAKWERLKDAYYAMPEEARMMLPEIQWPPFVTEQAIGRARTAVLVYQHATPAERKPLLDALACQPLSDSELFGLTTHETRTLPLPFNKTEVEKTLREHAAKQATKKPPRGREKK